MPEMYKEGYTEAVLVVDAANALNSINRKVFLHNINVVFPSISIYVLLYITVTFTYHWRDRDTIF